MNTTSLPGCNMLTTWNFIERFILGFFKFYWKPKVSWDRRNNGISNMFSESITTKAYFHPCHSWILSHLCRFSLTVYVQVLLSPITCLWFLEFPLLYSCGCTLSFPCWIICQGSAIGQSSLSSTRWTQDTRPTHLVFWRHQLGTTAGQLLTLLWTRHLLIDSSFQWRRAWQ